MTPVRYSNSIPNVDHTAISMYIDTCVISFCHHNFQHANAKTSPTEWTTEKNK